MKPVQRIGFIGSFWRTEPFAGFWQTASDLLQNNVLGFILSALAIWLGTRRGWLDITYLASVAFAILLRSPPLGNSFILFYAAGYLPFTVYAAIAMSVQNSIQFSKQLLQYPAVSWLDAIIARFLLLAAVILSMLVTPLAIAFAPHVAQGAARVSWLNRRLGANPPGVDDKEPHGNHVIVAGYGLAGRALCRRLQREGIPYVAVDMNPDNGRDPVEDYHALNRELASFSPLLSGFGGRSGDR